MSIYSGKIILKTNGEVDIIDITDDIQKEINKSNIKNGIICVFVPGSTGTLTTIEYELGLKKDFPEFLERIIPKNKYYKHHETWNDDNGHSHVRASLMGPSVNLPLIDGKLVHGTWQQIVFIELDTSKRNRNLICQIVGE